MIDCCQNPYGYGEDITYNMLNSQLYVPIMSQRGSGDFWCSFTVGTPIAEEGEFLYLGEFFVGFVKD